MHSGTAAPAAQGDTRSPSTDGASNANEKQSEHAGHANDKYVSKSVLADREYMKGDRAIDYASGHGY